MLSKILRFLYTMIILVVLISLLVFGLPRLITELYSITRISTPQEASVAPVAIVFGAGLNRDGTATPVLRHRVETAADLYFQGKVRKILMSGDNRFVEYNEPAAMFDHAVQLGVPAQDIVLDYAGRRTYDTCYRARDIFLVEKALLVTQRFHLPRALFICNMLGVEAQGVNANRVTYRKVSRLTWNVRELPATLMALVEVLITKPEPVLGDQEPIFSQEEANQKEIQTE